MQFFRKLRHSPIFISWRSTEAGKIDGDEFYIVSERRKLRGHALPHCRRKRKRMQQHDMKSWRAACGVNGRFEHCTQNADKALRGSYFDRSIACDCKLNLGE